MAVSADRGVRRSDATFYADARLKPAIAYAPIWTRGNSYYLVIRIRDAANLCGLGNFASMSEPLLSAIRGETSALRRLLLSLLWAMTEAIPARVEENLGTDARHAIDDRTVAATA